ncbi:MAG: DNA-directed RNA polymerase subunit alpha C-terminal domain-containing protein [Bacteroides fragilis]
MPEITEYKLEEYRQLKQQKYAGELLTPEILRSICRTLKYDPEAIGSFILKHLKQLPKRNPSIPEDPELNAPRTINDLEITVRAYNILRKNGYLEIEKLLQLTEKDLRSLEGMGKVNANSVLSELRKNGMSLKK